MTGTETPHRWEPPMEPLAVATVDNIPAENISQLVVPQSDAPQDEGVTKFLVGARSFRREDGEITCTTDPETEVWKEIIEGGQGRIIVARSSPLLEAATRLSMIGLLAVESRGAGGLVTVRLHPNAVIEDLRENPADPYSERFVEEPHRSLAQIKTELERRKFAVVDVDTELELPYVNGVDPTTSLRDAYAPYLKHYNHDTNKQRLRVTGLVAMNSEVDLVQSLKPVIPIPGREKNAFDFVDMLGSKVIREICRKGWYLLPGHYKQDLPLLYSFHRFRTKDEIADTAHTDEGVLNGILRLDQVSDTDGGWSYVLQPKRGRHAREGVYEKRALYAGKLPVRKMLLLLDNEVGHTSKRATGKTPSSDTFVAALLPSVPLLI